MAEDASFMRWLGRTPITEARIATLGIIEQAKHCGFTARAHGMGECRDRPLVGKGERAESVLDFHPSLLRSWYALTPPADAQDLRRTRMGGL